MSNTPLASEFPAAVKADWLKLVEQGLKGIPFDKALVTRLYEGIAVQPLYTRQDAAFPLQRHIKAKDSGAPPWTVIQLLDHLNIQEANRQLKEDLNYGARAVVLQLGGNIPYGGAYIGARCIDEFAQVFDGVPLENFEIYISGGFDTLPGVALFLGLAEKRGLSLEKLRGSAGLDPISIIAASGYIPAARDKITVDAVDAAHYLRDKGCGLTPLLVSGRAWHQAGGSAVDELAFTLAASIAYWRALEASGFSTAEALAATDIMLTAETDFFLTIAKFRSARLLWARAAEAAGVPSKSFKLLGEMSFRSLTERDPYVNLLRGTAATFGAAIGGADGILLIPFNTRSGTPDAFARRLARNTQLILMEEAHLGRVADPVGGSWYVENLTQDITKSAWDLFREVEAQGGLVAALESGYVGDKLHEVRRKRARNIASGRDALTGVSSFPHLSEKPVSTYEGDANVDLETLNREGDVPILPPAGKGERLTALIAAAKEGATLRGLERALETVYERRVLLPPSGERLAEPFERLRRASDLALYRVGARPPIFVAALGSPADFTARLTWLRSFFEAGGIEVLTGQGFETLEDLRRAFRDSPAPVACLCSSDKVYSAMPGAAPAMKNAGAAALYVAVTPEGLDAFSADDQRAIDRILYQGCDMLGIHEELHHIMRVDEMGNAAYEEDEEEDI